MNVKIFRWRAIGPLLVLLVIGCVLWWLFADTIARRESQKVGTQMLGARVEIDQLHLDIRNGKVLMHGVTIASPHEAFKNLFVGERRGPAVCVEDRCVQFVLNLSEDGDKPYY